MKKLLLVLSMVGASCASIPPLIYSNLNYNSNLNSNINNNNEGFTINKNSELITTKRDGAFTYYDLILTPNIYEDLVNLYWNTSTDSQYERRFRDVAVKNIDGASDNTATLRIGKAFWDAYYSIFDTYKDSSKQQRIKISLEQVYSNFDLKTRYLSSSIVTDDTITYENPYLDKLKEVFNGDLNQKTVNLGIISINSEEEITKLIGEKYPKIDLTQIKIQKIEEYSYFAQGYLLKLEVKGASEDYSIGTIQNDFIFNTTENFKKIDEIISNDSDVKLWIKHIEDFKTTIERQIKEDVPSFTPEQKNVWKDTTVEIMKGYIRDWSIIQRLIFDELKIDELKTSIDKINVDLDNLRKEIDRINNKLDDILKKENKVKCGDVTKIGSAVSKFIPGIGSILSIAFSVVGVLCNVAEA